MLPDDYSLGLATDADIDAIHEHLAHEMSDNGEGGLFFSPYDPDEPPRPLTAERREALAAGYARPLSEPLWQRTWVLRHRAFGGRVLGSLSLYGGRLPSELHRASLGMGIEPEHRERRCGSAMVDHALRWAREQPQLRWIDLGVFSMNARARALYTRFGFVEVSERRDAFRVRGVSITDISMTLAL